MQKYCEKKHQEEQDMYNRKQALWGQYETLVTAQTHNIKAFLSLIEKSQRAAECQALISTITASETFKKHSALEQEKWHRWATSIVDNIDPVLAFEMPDLMDEQNCLTKAVFAKAINEAGLDIQIPVPSVSFEDILIGLEALALCEGSCIRERI